MLELFIGRKTCKTRNIDEWHRQIVWIRKVVVGDLGAIRAAPSFILESIYRHLPLLCWLWNIKRIVVVLANGGGRLLESLILVGVTWGRKEIKVLRVHWFDLWGWVDFIAVGLWKAIPLDVIYVDQPVRPRAGKLILFLIIIIISNLRRCIKGEIKCCVLNVSSILLQVCYSKTLGFCLRIVSWLSRIFKRLGPKTCGKPIMIVWGWIGEKTVAIFLSITSSRWGYVSIAKAHAHGTVFQYLSSKACSLLSKSHSIALSSLIKDKARILSFEIGIKIRISVTTQTIDWKLEIVFYLPKCLDWLHGSIVLYFNFIDQGMFLALWQKILTTRVIDNIEWNLRWRTFWIWKWTLSSNAFDKLAN